jgi:hypothetical protein
MAKVKLSLNPSPTFSANVNIPVAGGAPVPVQFTFKHRTRDALREFLDKLKDRDDVDVVLDIASGWDLEDPFGKKSVEQMVQNYIGSAKAVIDTYLTELTAQRLGNS